MTNAEADLAIHILSGEFFEETPEARALEAALSTCGCLEHFRVSSTYCRRFANGRGVRLRIAIRGHLAGLHLPEAERQLVELFDEHLKRAKGS